MQFWAAYVHFAGLAVMASCLVAEYFLVSISASIPALKRLRYVDAGYGITACIMILSGIGRIYSEKGVGYYMESPWFWAKMALFTLAALASAYPTFCFFRPKNRSEMALPIAKIRLCLQLQIVLLAGIIACAVMMARG